MKKITTLSALVLSLSLSQISIAHADHQRCDFGSQRMEHVVDKLNLTTEQHKQFKKISEEAKQSIMPKHKEMRALRDKINAAFKAGNVDSAQQDTFVNDEKEIIGSILKIRMTERVEINKILTDAQKAKLSDMKKKWMDKHDGKHDSESN